MFLHLLRSLKNYQNDFEKKKFVSPTFRHFFRNRGRSSVDFDLHQKHIFPDPTSLLIPIPDPLLQTRGPVDQVQQSRPWNNLLPVQLVAPFVGSPDKNAYRDNQHPLQHITNGLESTYLLLAPLLVKDRMLASSNTYQLSSALLARFLCNLIKSL